MASREIEYPNWRIRQIRPVLACTLGLAGALLLVLGSALPAAATTASRAIPTASDSATDHAQSRDCTPLGCPRRRADPLGSAAGFGASVLAAGWLARRRAGRGG